MASWFSSTERIKKLEQQVKINVKELVGLNELIDVRRSETDRAIANLKSNSYKIEKIVGNGFKTTRGEYLSISTAIGGCWYDGNGKPVSITDVIGGRFKDDASNTVSISKIIGGYWCDKKIDLCLIMMLLVNHFVSFISINFIFIFNYS